MNSPDENVKVNYFTTKMFEYCHWQSPPRNVNVTARDLYFKELLWLLCISCVNVASNPAECSDVEQI